MAGETIKTEAICLDVRPWSRTSHVVSWLTPHGKVATLVKGAVRARSAFLGQYDLNYTCEIVYYARAKGELHALRDCAPVDMRESLRGDWRALALAGYFRSLAGMLAPQGADCRSWYDLLARALADVSPNPGCLVRFELAVLSLAGLAPDFSGYDRAAEWSPFSIEAGVFGGAGRSVRVSREVAAYLHGGGRNEKNPQTPLDAARVIGVFYQFHLDCASDVRRAVFGMVVNNKEGNGQR